MRGCEQGAGSRWQEAGGRGQAKPGIVKYIPGSR